MILAALLLMQAPVGPTVQQIVSLPPAAAGDLVLRGQSHGPVVAVVEQKPGPLQPPNTADWDVVEQAVEHGPGCRRQRWNATFRKDEGAEAGSAVLDGLYSATEIKLTDQRKCPTEGYVHLNRGIAPDDGFAALAQLEKVRSGAQPVEFVCSDQTSSNLCGGGADGIRRALQSLNPWAVARENGTVAVWLGTPGQAVTQVRFGLDGVGRVEVTRAIPAPA